MHIGFTIHDLSFSKLYMYKPYHNNLQPDIGGSNPKCYYMSTDSFQITFQTDGLVTEYKKAGRL